MKIKRMGNDPSFLVRIICCTMTLVALLSFFFPFLNLAPNALVEIVTGIFGTEAKARDLSGFALIFAFTSNKTLHESVDIGPLPCNAFVAAAFLLGLFSAIVLFIRRFGAWRYLATAVGTLLSCVSLILCPIFFTAYYARFTKNGGEQLRNLLEEGKLIMSVQPFLVISAILLGLTFMVSFLFFFQALADPFYTKEPKIEN